MTYTVRRNNIEVAASHRFCNAAPVTIAIYYGMQSMFEGETHVLTPGGAYTDWTEAAKASTFTKQEYPLFRRYVEKNRQGYQSTWLLPDGLGDHALLDGQDDIFIYAPYGKSYHKLIGNKRMENGDKTCWRGVYTWFETPVADDADLLCYEGSAGGHTAVFIDCKRACKRTLALPGYLDQREEPAGKSRFSILRISFTEMARLAVLTLAVCTWPMPSWHGSICKWRIMKKR